MPAQRIYVSSTTEDLGAARAAVAKQIRGMGHDPVYMEEYSASSLPAVEKCLRDVAQCDLYVGIFAFRYGYVPPGHEQSVTELEYRRAKQCEKPTLVFLLDERAEHWPLALIDRGENGMRIERLRGDLMQQQGHTVCLFQSETDLLTKMPQAIREFVEPPLPPPPPPASPPRERIVGIVFQDPQPFQDRDEEIQRLRGLLQGHAAKFIPVVGRRGTGKTALVSQLCLAIERGELRLCDSAVAMGVDGIVYFDCRGAGSQTAERLFHDLGKLLEPREAEDLTQFWGDAERSYAEKFRLLFSNFRRGCYLLALDNLEEVLGPEHTIQDGSLQAFFDVCLTTPHGLRIVATSGESVLLSGEAQHHMHPFALDEGLPVADAVALLRKLDTVGELGLREAPDALLRQAVESCYGLPRALISVVAILSADPTLTLEELLANTALFREHVIENLIAEQYQRQSNDRRRVLEALAVFNKPVRAAAVRHLLAAFFPRIDADRCLRDLVHSHFVGASRARATYEMPPLLQQYAYSQIPDEPDGYGKLLCHRVAAEYHASIRAAADQWKSLDDVQPQLDEFAHRLLARQYDEAAALIDAVDADCLRIWGHYRTVITLREQLLEKLTDPDLLQSNLGNLAMVYRRTGRLRDAVSYFERAIAHARHADNKTALAKWHCELGNTFADLVEMDQAVEQYQQAIGIARRNNDLSGEARPLGNLAIAHRQLGNIREALNCYQQAIRIDEQRAAQAATHAERHEALRQRAMHVANSGKSYLALGQFQEARKCFQEGAEFMHADNYKYAEAVFVSHLGEADVARGAFADALGHFQKGIEILEQTGERRNLSYMLEGLGGAHHYLGNLADARACYEKCRECDVPETNYRGDVMLGLLDLEEGRRQPARDHLADSIALCRQLRSKTPHFYEAIYRQALALLARGDERDALATYEEALQACRAEGVVSAGLQELELLCRAAPDTPALDDTQRMLQAAMTQPSD